MGLLDNTYWLINTDADFESAIYFSVDFESEGERFDSIRVFATGVVYYGEGGFASVIDSYGEWTDEAYRRIKINSTDDEDFAAWLPENAVQIIFANDHAITCGVGDNPFYSGITFFQNDFGSGTFTVTVNGFADLGFFDSNIFISYQYCDTGSGYRIVCTKEYPCEVIYDAAVNKVKTAVPDEVFRIPGKWAGQLHIYDGDTRRSTNIFTFGIKPDVAHRER